MTVKLLGPDNDVTGNCILTCQECTTTLTWEGTRMQWIEKARQAEWSVYSYVPRCLTCSKALTEHIWKTLR